MAVSKTNIDLNKKVENPRSRQDEFDFVEAILKSIVKATIAIGMIIAYYKDDKMMMLLIIGIAILTLSCWKKGGKEE